MRVVPRRLDFWVLGMLIDHVPYVYDTTTGHWQAAPRTSTVENRESRVYRPSHTRFNFERVKKHMTSSSALILEQNMSRANIHPGGLKSPKSGRASPVQDQSDRGDSFLYGMLICGDKTKPPCRTWHLLSHFHQTSIRLGNGYALFNISIPSFSSPGTKASGPLRQC